MGLLVNGEWCTEGYRCDEKGRFLRDATKFHGQIRADGSTGFLPEAGRYHLYVSYACPWANRTLIMRNLKGLQEAVPVSAVHWLMADDGWTFEGTEDPVNGARFLREVYVKAKPDYTGRVTVPVLWDRETGTIVNNESRQVMRMLDTEFPGGEDLYPEGLRDRVDQAIDALYGPINNGVYRAGFAKTQEAHEEAVAELFAALDHWEDVLAGQPYLCGDRLTEADVCMFTTLFRFDPVYHVHFKCNRRRLVDYPHLSAYMRLLYGRREFAETCHMDHIKSHYYLSHRFLNPSGLVPVGPDRDFRDPT